MDDKMDIQKSNPLLRFFDKNAVRTSPFGGNQSADRAYRRAERVVAAIYLITKHVSTEEPLRASIRTEALKLLEATLSLRNDMRAVDSAPVAACRASVRHLVSLVRMIAVSGFLSVQNASAVIEGLDELGNLINTVSHSPLSERMVFSSETFMDIQENASKDIKDTLGIKDKTTLKDIAHASNTVGNSGGLSVREQGIMGILRAGGEFGIRDITANLPEYSEKMIQRDLLALVLSGKVKKTGLKRWSRYSIA